MANYKKEANKANKQRKERDANYQKFNVEPTEVNGVIVRSRLEALWIERLSTCESFKCSECVQVPLWINGVYGRFLTNYKPDLVIETEHGRILVELKPTHEVAMADDRQKRALELNPSYKFVVIGGYPYSRRGVTVRMLTGKKEIVHRYVNVCDVLRFLECECEEQ